MKRRDHMSRIQSVLSMLVVLMVVMISCSIAGADMITSSATAKNGDIIVSLSIPNAIIDATGYGQYAGYPQAHVEAWQEGALVSSKSNHDVIGSVTATTGTATATAGTDETCPIKPYLSSAQVLLADSTGWSVASSSAEFDYAYASTSLFHRVAFFAEVPVTVTFTVPYELISTGNSSAWVWANLYSGWIGSNINSNDYAEYSADGSGSISVSLDYLSGQIGFFTYYVGTQAVAGSQAPLPPSVLLFGFGIVGLSGLRKRFMKK